MKSPRLLLLAIVMTMAGCASSGGPPSMFLLDAAQAAPGANRVSGPVLIIDPVTVAPFLSESGIVYQTEPHRVVIANNNRWASPLDSQLTDALYTALSQTLTDVSVRQYGRSAPSGMHLVTHVSEFMGHYDGQAHIAGRWQLIDASGSIRASRQFEQRVPLDSDGYGSLVDRLSEGWRNTAKDMAAALDSVVDTR